MKRIYIEITNLCNLHCRFCLRPDRKQTSMTPNQFRSIITQSKPYTDYVYLHVQGEPLLHPRFEEIMDICDAYGMKVQLVTNGTMPERIPDPIRHPSLRKVSFSVQSIDDRPDADAHEYTADVVTACRRLSEAGITAAEIRFWQKTPAPGSASAACLQYLKDHYTFIPDSRQRNFRIMDHVYVDFADEFEWPSLSHPLISETGTCHGAIDQIAVLSNGTAVPCCLDAGGAVKLGNIFETSLESILQSEAYRSLTEGFRRNELREELCRRCGFRTRFDKTVSK